MEKSTVTRKEIDDFLDAYFPAGAGDKFADTEEQDLKGPRKSGSRLILECKLPESGPVHSFVLKKEEVVDYVHSMDLALGTDEGRSQNQALSNAIGKLRERLIQSGLAQRLFICLCGDHILYVTDGEAIEYLLHLRKQTMAVKTRDSLRRAILFAYFRGGSAEEQVLAKKIAVKAHKKSADKLEEALRQAKLPDSVIKAFLQERRPPQSALRVKTESVTPNTPAVPEAFTGRGAILRKLKRLLRPGKSHSTQRIGIHGLPGVGKTALAAKAVSADEVSARFTNEVYWVRVGQERTGTAIIGELLKRATGLETSALEPSETVKKFHEAFTKRECLIVLDDVWRCDQVQAFTALQSSSCVLALSRNRELLEESLDTCGSLQVLPLKDDDSEKLLQSIAPEEVWTGLRAQEIIAHCGGLPLALMLIGNRARRIGSEATAEILKAHDLNRVKGFLQSYHGEESAYGTEGQVVLFQAIDISVEALAPHDKTAYLRLAALPEKAMVPIEALANILGLPAGLAEDTATSLVDRSLLTSENGRVFLHDMLYAYLICRAKQAEDEEYSLHGHHRAILQNYANKCTGGESKTFKDESNIPWWKGPNDGYFLENIARHMVDAHMHKSLKHLVTSSFRWAQRKDASPVLVGSYLNDIQLGIHGALKKEQAFTSDDILDCLKLCAAKEIALWKRRNLFALKPTTLALLGRTHEAVDRLQAIPSPLERAKELVKVHSILCAMGGQTEAVVRCALETKENILNPNELSSVSLCLLEIFAQEKRFGEAIELVGNLCDEKPSLMVRLSDRREAVYILFKALMGAHEFDESFRLIEKPRSYEAIQIGESELPLETSSSTKEALSIAHTHGPDTHGFIILIDRELGLSEFRRAFWENENGISLCQIKETKKGDLLLETTDGSFLLVGVDNAAEAQILLSEMPQKSDKTIIVVDSEEGRSQVRRSLKFLVSSKSADAVSQSIESLPKSDFPDSGIVSLKFENRSVMESYQDAESLLTLSHEYYRIGKKSQASLATARAFDSIAVLPAKPKIEMLVLALEYLGYQNKYVKNSLNEIHTLLQKITNSSRRFVLTLRTALALGRKGYTREALQFLESVEEYRREHGNESSCKPICDLFSLEVAGGLAFAYNEIGETSQYTTCILSAQELIAHIQQPIDRLRAYSRFLDSKTSKLPIHGVAVIIEEAEALFPIVHPVPHEDIESVEVVINARIDNGDIEKAWSMIAKFMPQGKRHSLYRKIVRRQKNAHEAVDINLLREAAEDIEYNNDQEVRFNSLMALIGDACFVGAHLIAEEVLDKLEDYLFTAKPTAHTTHELHSLAKMLVKIKGQKAAESILLRIVDAYRPSEFCPQRIGAPTPNLRPRIGEFKVESAGPCLGLMAAAGGAPAHDAVA